MLSVNHLPTPTIVDAANDEFAVKQRLNSFKLGKAMPPSLSMDATGAANNGHRHRRSHSRNVSMSSVSSQAPSLPSSRSSGHHDLSSFSFGSLSTSSSALAMSSSESAPSALPNSGLAPPAPKRNSHHRRRSSVSTRHESAELMGVSLPDLPSMSMEDNVNLGEKDSIRRRALWALEGKPDVSYGKVEIPELGTPDMEKMMFDFSTKPSLSGGPSAGFGSPMMNNKRDSFKLLPPSGSNKDQLHTLLEEEEEEEEEECDSQARKDPQDSLPSPTTSNEEGDFPAHVNAIPAVAKAPTSRPRPATLHLRPLSLTPDTVGSTGLPTPSLTPSPRSGLRSLCLNPAPAADDSTDPDAKRDAASRRPMLNLNTDSATDSPSNYGDRKQQRRSSISYRRSSSHSSFGLPTPEMTPTFNRRCSVSESIRSSKSGEEEFFPAHPSYRPLSASEQHFLYKSHNALLARITDLEKALSMRRTSISGYSISGSSRPSSVLSDVSLPSEFGSPASSGPGEPSDEMLALIRDLKAERDELKKDVDGWRTRVADLDKQLVLVAKRVDNERKEAWVARSRVGLLEAEKAILAQRLEHVDQTIANLEGEKVGLEKENLLLRQENEEKDKRIRELEEELRKLKMERELDSGARTPASYDLDPMATPTPLAFDQKAIWSKGLGLGTSLEVEDQSFNFGLGGDDGSLEEEDGLVGYEDENECDPELETSSSFDSFSDYPERSIEHLATNQSTSFTTEEPTRSTHRSQNSLSRTWTFPKIIQTASHERSDKAFGSPDESDASDDSEPDTPLPFSYEESRDLFASALKFADEGDAPFYIPGGVGTVVEAPIHVPEVKNERPLGVLTEEDEETEQDSLWDMEDEEMFGEIGGIRIIFTPPEEEEEVEEVEQIKFVTPVKPVSAPPTLPAFDFGRSDEKDDINSFMFGDASPPGDSPCTAQSAPLSAPFSPPKPKPSMIAAPSSIPRSTAFRSTSPPSAIPRPASRTSSTHSTSPQVPPPQAIPTSKRGGAFPSFIPQPVSSPSPSRNAISKPKSPTPGSTFVRQTSCTNPLSPTSPKITSSKLSTTFANEETMNIAAHRSSERRFVSASSQCHPNHRSPSETNMKSVDLRDTSDNPSLPGAAYSTSESSAFASIPPVSSILPAPISSKLSFSTFSTLLPLSWSARPSVEVTPVATTQAEGATSFVSRKQQLLKLRIRMQGEGVGIVTPSLPCRRCDVHTVVEL